MDIINQYFSDFSTNQIEQFNALAKLYQEWNEKINVISRKDLESLYEKHVLHSLAIAAIANFKDNTKIVDIGTGGGFPGIPLAIFYPNVDFLLVDSIGKKINVVNEIALALGLSNVKTLKGRAEDIKNMPFDFAVTRAVAPLGKLWNWIQPNIRKGFDNADIPNGLLALKGGDLSMEIKESGLKPFIFNLKNYFKEPFFDTKQLLFVKA